jgi:hypothetical protein
MALGRGSSGTRSSACEFRPIGVELAVDEVFASALGD